MINIENKVIDAVKTSLSSYSETVSVYGEYVDVPGTFPCVTVLEVDNIPLRNTMDEVLHEHHATITYEINVYTNSKANKKAKAKEISSIIDTCMLGMKFNRMSCIPTINMDRSIYRISMRYNAVVAEGVTNGNTTVYQMHRT